MMSIFLGQGSLQCAGRRLSGKMTEWESRWVETRMGWPFRWLAAVLRTASVEGTACYMMSMEARAVCKRVMKTESDQKRRTNTG